MKKILILTIVFGAVAKQTVSPQADRMRQSEERARLREICRSVRGSILKASDIVSLRIVAEQSMEKKIDILCSNHSACYAITGLRNVWIIRE